MTSRAALIRDNLLLLEQMRALLLELDDELYAAPAEAAYGGSVGGHVRHCIDFFASFIARGPDGRVDYDERLRDPILESQCARARERLAEIGVDLARELHRTEIAPVRVKLDSSSEEDGPWSVSSVERELQALLSHALHHCALIAVILRLNGRAPPEGFGVTPSTLRHWRRMEECSR